MHLPLILTGAGLVALIALLSGRKKPAPGGYQDAKRGSYDQPGVPGPIPGQGLRLGMNEKQRLDMLEPTTKAFALDMLRWSRERGFNATLGETWRSRAAQAKAYEDGRSAISPGQLGWHSVGRAFHIVIRDPRGKLDLDAYKIVGEEVRRRGGTWMGDRMIKGRKGFFQDLAHFEYHPGLTLRSYRGSSLAKKELAIADSKASSYT